METEISHRIIVGKPLGKRLLGRMRRRWEDSTNYTMQVNS
jgi:hypothetical protein